tara:strand:+ start:2380 stop:2517 length:138 start_codon:yes stop_codon:yes gene_type:complete
MASLSVQEFGRLFKGIAANYVEKSFLMPPFSCVTDREKETLMAWF